MRLTELLKAVSFSSPPRCRVIVFDSTGAELLVRMSLEGFSHWVFPARFERFYFGLPILFRMVVNLFRHVGWMPPFTPTSLRGFLFRVYAKSCLEHSCPIVVVTFVENSYTFQWLSRACKGVRFIAVQNGMRLVDNVTTSLPLSPDPASVISLPDFLCFGEFERDLYLKYGHKIDRFHPVGSLRGGYYRNVLMSKKVPSPAFDICLVSEWDRSIMTGSYFPEFRKALRFLESFLKRYAQEQKVRVSIAGRHQDDSEAAEEEAYYRALIPEAEFIRCDRLRMSTYFAMDNSRVVLSVCCTAALEALGWGKKALFCNFTGLKSYDHPLPKGCLLSEPDYGLFKDSLDALIEIPDAEFLSVSSAAAAYRMNYSGAPAHEYLRRMLEETLA